MTFHREFNRTVDEALNSDFLQTALRRATGTFKAQRTRLIGELGDFEDLRRRARAAKNRVLDRLDEYLEQLEESVVRAGGRVFWAADGSEAVDYVLKLAARKGVRRIVKGKSMATEEIRLNPALEGAGLEVFETDLGEYILQLCGQRPSHLIIPAVHKTREEIACLFQEKLGLAYTDDPAEMTAAVRERLRSRFLDADMGVTGANFAVAETGTLVLLENEGNIRMSTTLPRIHVAIMGLEKVVADLSDLALLLRLLPVSATGQRLSGYVSMITGPGRRDGEGPEELHLILLDGWRTRVWNDPEFHQILRCLRCGACLNFCPVYRRIGGHSYPWTYSGPIGAVLTAAALGVEAAADVVSASTLCRACAQVCPVMIELPDLILAARRRTAEQHPVISALTEAVGRFLAAPGGWSLATRAADLGARSVFDPGGGLRYGPGPLRALAEGRCLPRPARPTFHRGKGEGD